MPKKIFTIFFLIILSSLIISSLFPQESAHKYFYHALWFKSLWGIMALGLLLNAVLFIRRKNFSSAIIYLGLLLVILGGGVTSFFAKEGFVEIKEGQTVNGFWIDDDLFWPVDFSVSLNDFSVEFYPEKMKGMRFVKSYRSSIRIDKDGNLLKSGVIEVNKPMRFSGFWFYQYGYDEALPDQTVLQVVRDPGLPFVYVGYLILLSGMFFSFKRTFYGV